MSLSLDGLHGKKPRLAAEAVNGYLWGMKLYNLAYYVGMAWFAYWCFRTAVDDVQYWDAVPYLITAVTPCVALWAARRIKTGQWIS